MIITRGKKYAKRRTGKRNPHHHDIFVMRYCHAHTRTRSLTPTESAPPGSAAWSIGFARCHSSEDLSFFLYPCRYCNARDDDPSWTSCVNDHTVSDAWWGGNDSFFHFSLSLIDERRTALLSDVLFDAQRSPLTAAFSMLQSNRSQTCRLVNIDRALLPANPGDLLVRTPPECSEHGPKDGA